MNKHIRSLMILHGMNNSDLAEYLKLSRPSISFKLNKKRDFTQSELQLMADRFNVSVDYLLERSK